MPDLVKEGLREDEPSKEREETRKPQRAVHAVYGDLDACRVPAVLRPVHPRCASAVPQRDVVHDGNGIEADEVLSRHQVEELPNGLRHVERRPGICPIHDPRRHGARLPDEWRPGQAESEDVGPASSRIQPSQSWSISQDAGSKAEPYQIRQIQRLVERYDFRLDEVP